MIQFFDKTNKWATYLTEYKEELDFKSRSFDEIRTVIKGTPIIVSIKIDGILSLIHFQDNKSYLITKEGRVVEELPLLTEINTILKDKKETILIGEFYGVDNNDKELPFNETLSLTRKPSTEEDEKRIRLGIFDIHKYDGKDTKDNKYKDRMLLIQELFENDKYSKPVYAKNDDGSSVLEEMWEDHIVQEGHEGLVLQTEGETVKIKPNKDIDALVIAVKPDKYGTSMGSLFLALLDEENSFRTLSFVGTGFSDKDRKEWFEWANKNRVNNPNHDNLIWIDIDKDPRVVEVDYEQALVKELETFNFKDGKWVPNDTDKLSTTLRKPVFIRIRDDKNVNDQDLRLSQIPELDEAILKKKSFRVQAYYPKHPNTIIVKKNKFYSKPLLEKDIWQFFDKVKYKIIDQTKGKNVLIYLRVDGDIIKRKNDGILRIDNVNDFNRLNAGRMIEIHAETSYERGNKYYTDIVFCDIDPQENFKFDNTKDLVKKVYAIFKKDQHIKNVKINFSGGRGFHIIGNLKQSWDVDSARNYTKRLLKQLETDRVKLGIVREKNMARLDTSLLKARGSLRVAYSFNKETGLVAVPLLINEIDKFEKEDATIYKVLKKLDTKKAFKLTAYKLYLDDERFPQSVGWDIVRTLADFKNIIQEKGLPSEISFDHDLGPTETGYMAAKWLVDNEYDLRSISINVHSANPIGKDNIYGIINSWNNFLDKEKKSFKINCSEKLTATIQISDIPKELINILNNVQSTIDKDLLYDDTDKVNILGGFPDKFHITVLYNIDTKDKEVIQNICSKYKNINIETLDKISYIDDNDYTSAALVCESKDLTNLRNELLSTINHNDEFVEFFPHISIAYLKPKTRIKNIEIEPTSWKTNELEISNNSNIEKLIKKSFKIQDLLSERIEALPIYLPFSSTDLVLSIEDKIEEFLVGHGINNINRVIKYYANDEVLVAALLRFYKMIKPTQFSRYFTEEQEKELSYWANEILAQYDIQTKKSFKINSEEINLYTKDGMLAVDDKVYTKYGIANKLFKLKSSILDYPKLGLEPKVWQYDGSINPKVKEQIINKLSKLIEEQGYNPKEVIRKIYLIGSLTSYQYNKYTDLDVHVFLNLNKMLGS